MTFLMVRTSRPPSSAESPGLYPCIFLNPETDRIYGNASDTSDTVFSYNRADIRDVSAPYLKPYLKDGRPEVLGSGRSVSTSFLPSEVAQKITKWIKDPCSSFLWVEGPVFTPAERQLSVIAMLLYELAMGGESPVPSPLNWRILHSRRPTIWLGKRGLSSPCSTISQDSSYSCCQ